MQAVSINTSERMRCVKSKNTVLEKTFSNRFSVGEMRVWQVD